MARVPILLVALLLVACGGSPPPSASPSPTSGPVQAVVRIDQTGGMLPAWETISWYPSAVLYSDGRLITPGPQMDIYPGPALPNLQVTQLTPEGVAQILQAAIDSGFAGPERDIGEQLLDAGAMVFTVTTADGTHVTRLHGANGDASVAAALRFRDALLSPRQWFEGAVIGDDRPYAFERLQIVSAPMTAAQMPDPGAVNVVAWPLAALATIGFTLEPGQPYRCTVVEGDDLATLRPLLDAAHQLTLFESDGDTYQLRLRPLLPGEEGCQAPPA